MIDGWDKAQKAALKILGDDGKIPKPKATLDKADAAGVKAWEAVCKAREQLEDLIEKLLDTDSACVNALEDFRDTIDSDDLGLDPKNKDDAKKLKDAKATLFECIDDALDRAKNNMTNERELKKHLQNIANYKRDA